MSSLNWLITLASCTFTSNPVFNFRFLIGAKKLTASFPFTSILFKIKSCKCFSALSSDFNRPLTIKSSSKVPNFMFFAVPALNGSSTSPSFVASLFILFSCFLRAPKVVSLCFEEVRPSYVLSKHFVVSLISDCFSQIYS